MGVKDVTRRSQQMLPELQDPVSMGRIMRRQGKHAEASVKCAGFEFAPFRADNELGVPVLVKAVGQAK
jgi:hypothetical protein